VGDDESTGEATEEDVRGIRRAKEVRLR